MLACVLLVEATVVACLLVEVVLSCLFSLVAILFLLSIDDPTFELSSIELFLVVKSVFERSTLLVDFVFTILVVSSVLLAPFVSTLLEVLVVEATCSVVVWSFITLVVALSDEFASTLSACTV